MTLTMTLTDKGLESREEPTMMIKARREWDLFLLSFREKKPQTRSKGDKNDHADWRNEKKFAFDVTFLLSLLHSRRNKKT